METSHFKDVLTAMFMRTEYHHPFVAAQRQFRERYYGLASAAMLEDLFFDSLSSYLRTHLPGEDLNRPPHGQKGYDYELSGVKYSHKVSKSGPIHIAALWDATRTDVEAWTFDYPICFVPGDYSMNRLPFQFVDTGRAINLKAAASLESIDETASLLLGSWSGKGQILTIAEVIEPKGQGPLLTALPFEDMWTVASALSATGCSSNAIELFVTNRGQRSAVEVGTRLQLDSQCFRPGMYLFDRKQLIDIPVSHNNRAILVPKSYVAELMTKAIVDNSFVPITTWFGGYSGLNPPDLYLSQRVHYDQMFSIYSKH